MIEMAVDVSGIARLLGTSLGVDAEDHASTTSLGVITLTRYATFAIINSRATNKGVATETLSTILRTSDAKSSSLTVGHTLGVGHGVLTNVGELDARENTIFCISIAAMIGPSCRDSGSRSWRSTGSSNCSPNDSALGNV